MQSEERYEALLDTYRKKFELDLNRSKTLTMSLEKELNNKSADLVKSNLEVKKLQRLLSKYMTEENQSTTFVRFDNTKVPGADADKVIRANSYEGT